MKTKSLSIFLLMLFMSNSMINNLNADWQEELLYGLSAGIALGGLGGWAITWKVLTEKHEQELREKEEQHQKVREKLQQQLESLQDLISK